MCDAFPLEPVWCPTLPTDTHMPRCWDHPLLCPPLFRTRGAHHRGQTLWQEIPGTTLLFFVVATRMEPEQVLGPTPTHLYGLPHGAAPVPHPPAPGGKELG